MSIRQDISDKTKDAMRAKDKLRVSALRLVSAAIKDRDIAARAKDRSEGIADDEILSILAKMMKQRHESASTYEDNGRPDLAERERAEMDILREFMPQPLSEDDLKTAIDQFVTDCDATCLKDMGKIMGKIKVAFPGRVDMGKAGALVKARLTG